MDVRRWCASALTILLWSMASVRTAQATCAATTVGENKNYFLMTLPLGQGYNPAWPGANGYPFDPSITTVTGCAQFCDNERRTDFPAIESAQSSASDGCFCFVDMSTQPPPDNTVSSQPGYTLTTLQYAGDGSSTGSINAIPDGMQVLSLCQPGLLSTPAFITCAGSNIPASSFTDCSAAADECASMPCQHGGTCTDGTNSFTCQCVAGYSGVQCETDINECASQPCRNGATCHDGVSSYTCTCVAGYSGLRCETNIDECASTPCQNGGTCTDGTNAFTCQCVAGYSGPRCESGIDECASQPCRNGATCNDDVASYSCACRPGFSGVHCETDISECASLPCVHGVCIDGTNTYTCNCTGTGYNGTNCENQILVLCLSNPCQNGATCIESLNSYSCLCPNDYYGQNCQASPCRPDPCMNGGLCQVFTACNTSSLASCSYSYNCTCPYYTVTGSRCENAPDITFCDPSCGVGIDSCAPSAGMLNDALIDFPWFSGPTTVYMTAAPTFMRIDSTMLFQVSAGGLVTAMGFKGNNFTATLKSPFGDPAGEAMCTSSVGGEYLRYFRKYAFYVMTTNYTGDVSLYVNGQLAATCLFPGTAISSAASRFKFGGGDTNTPFHADFFGYMTRMGILQRYVTPFEVAQSYFSQDNNFPDTWLFWCPLPSGGTGFGGLPAIQPFGSFASQMSFMGFTGSPFCGPDSAINYAICNGLTCANCTAGHTSGCNIAPYGGSNCTCSIGWTGIQCETPVDYCASNPCVNGNCVNQQTGWLCNCNFGWTGKQCDVQLFACASFPCMNGATCTDSDDTLSFNCTCADGYRGRLCQSLVDNCASNPCVNGGTCHNGVASFTCSCAYGFAGAVCANLDPCVADAPCQHGSTCWTVVRCTDLTSPKSGLYAGQQQCVFAARDYLIIAGGLTDVELDTVTALHMTSGAIVGLGTLSMARHFQSGSPGVCNEQTGVFIIAGGYSSAIPGAYEYVDVYIFATGLWTSHRLSAGGGAVTSTAVFHDDFYVLTNSAEYAIDIFDGETGNPIRSTSVMFNGGGQTQIATALDDCFYIFQGVGVIPPTTQLLIYNSTSDQLTAIEGVFVDPLLSYSSPITVADRILFFAQQYNGGPSTGQTLIYTPTTNVTDTSQIAPSVAGFQQSTAAGGNERGIFVAFGVNGANDGTVMVSQYNPLTNKFSAMTNLTLPRIFGTAAYHAQTSTFAVSGGFNETNSIVEYQSRIDLYSSPTMQPLPQTAPRCVISYNCSCAMGFNGINCTQQLDPCASQPCVHGTCTVNFPHFYCNCTGTGYNGTTCQNDVNECATNNGGCGIGRACSNFVGGRNCSSCISGYFGNTTCAPCGVGTFSNASALLQCYSCTNGTFQAFTAATRCVDCIPGTFGPSRGGSSCIPCVPGTYASRNASVSCSACTAGKFQDTLQSTGCTNCTAGFYSSAAGQSSCPQCAPQTYQPQTGMTFCYNCTATSTSIPECATSSSSTGSAPAVSSSSSSTGTNSPNPPADQPLVVGASTPSKIAATSVVPSLVGGAIPLLFFFSFL